MKYRNLLTSLMLASAILFSGCSKQPPKIADETDTDIQSPVITDTEITAAPVPAITESPAEIQPPAEETTIPADTEPTAETEVPIVELPTEETEPTTEELQTQPTEEPIAPPPVFTKPIIDISDRLTADGAPVTGQIASVQSNHIKLLLDYTVQQQNGNVMLTLDVGLSCYELWCSAKTDMGTITVNGVSRTFSTEAINHMESEKAYIPFFTQSYNAAGGQSASIEVSWSFNGTYGGTEVGTLTTGVILQWDALPTVQPDDSAAIETAVPEIPDAPDTPAIPDAPDTPDIPDTPVSPDVPTEPTVPSIGPVNPPEPAEPPTEPAVPTEPGEDTTPVPETPPTEPEPDSEPTVTGTPEETVPTDEA